MFWNNIKEPKNLPQHITTKERLEEHLDRAVAPFHLPEDRAGLPSNHFPPGGHHHHHHLDFVFSSGFAHKGICYTSATLCPQDNSSLAGVKLKLVQRLRLRTGLPWWILKKLDRLRLRDGLPWWIWKKWTNLDYIPDCPDGFVKMDNGNWWVVKEKGTIFRSALMSIDMTH